MLVDTKIFQSDGPYPTDMLQSTRTTMETLAKSQGEGTERAQALQLDAVVSAQSVECVGTQDCARLCRRLRELRLASRSGSDFHGSYSGSKNQRSLLTSLKTTQQFDGVVGILLGNSVTDGADLGIRK